MMFLAVVLPEFSAFVLTIPSKPDLPHGMVCCWGLGIPARALRHVWLNILPPQGTQSPHTALHSLYRIFRNFTPELGCGFCCVLVEQTGLEPVSAYPFLGFNELTPINVDKKNRGTPSARTESPRNFFAMPTLLIRITSC